MFDMVLNKTLRMISMKKKKKKKTSCKNNEYIALRKPKRSKNTQQQLSIFNVWGNKNSQRI